MEETNRLPPVPEVPSSSLLRALKIPRALQVDRQGSANETGSSDGEQEHEEGILNMENYGDIPTEAFEIEEDELSSHAEFSNTFTYQRSAHRSILVSLGITGGQSMQTLRGHDPLNAYSKMDDQACVLTYMSVVVGGGTFSLSRAMAKIGWVQGIIVLVGLSVWHYLVAHLITCLPQMLECNFNTYVDIARACFGNRAAVVFLLLSGLCWWSACVFNLWTFQAHLEAVMRCWRPADHDHADDDLPLSLAVKLLCVLPSLGFIWRTRGNELVKLSKVSVKAMFAIAAIEIGAAAAHWLYNLLQRTPVWIVAWRVAETPEEVGQVGLMSALGDIISAYAGVGFWPYVIADMLNPHHAPQVVKKASLQVGVFYTCVGTICYLGWGEDLLHRSPIEKMLDLGMPYTVMASLISILFSAKAVCAYPLLFRPLMREIETAIASDELPCVELRLPWALKWQGRLKLAVRGVLLTSTLAALFLRQVNSGSSERSPFEWCAFLVFIFVQVFAPALFIVRSLFVHKQNLRKRSAGNHGGAGRRTRSFVRSWTLLSHLHTLNYIGGRVRSHFVISGIVAGISIYISVMLMGSKIWDQFSRVGADTLTPAANATLALGLVS